jgi:hypothetical protein
MRGELQKRRTTPFNITFKDKHNENITTQNARDSLAAKPEHGRREPNARSGLFLHTQQ